MPRSILFLNRVYPPAEGATGYLLSDLATALAKAGWQVTVVTTRATADSPRSETRNGVRIERINGLPFTRASHWRRALSYLSLYPALISRARRLPPTDIVVTMTDPPMHLIFGPFLKRKKNTRLIHWAQDIYPELAEQLGVLKPNRLIARGLRRLSTASLRRCDHIIVLGRCMKTRLLQRGLPAEKIRVIPNWSLATTPSDGQSFRTAHSLEGRFIVMYSGNLGLAHPFQAMINAAKIVSESHPQIIFLFIGDGPKLTQVKQAATGLNSIRFLPSQSLEKLADTLAAADLHLASMREDLCGLVVPSKVSGILAAGRPCIFLGPAESESAQLLCEKQCGLVLPSHDGPALAAVLTRLITHPQELATLRQNAETLAPSLGLPPALQAFQRLFN